MSLSINKPQTDTTEVPKIETLRFGLVVAQWNAHITHALRDAALAVLKEKGVADTEIEQVEVPGAMELPLAARMLIGSKNVDAVICLGCVIKGDTRHDEYINQAVATGLTQLSLTSGRACVFGLLTCENEAQALARAGGEHGNKGQEAAETAVFMASLRKQLGKTKSSIGF